MEQAFVPSVTRLADAELRRLLELPPGHDTAGLGHRGVMMLIKTASVAYLNERSDWHRQAEALARVPSWTAALRALQRGDGLFSSGDNLASPPDSSFTVNDMAIVRQLLSNTTNTTAGESAAGTTELGELRGELDSMVERITPALMTGGVHTPNHRWEIAAALARLDALTPDTDVRRRVDEWLAEGIDVAADGLYSERSPNYAAYVSNPSLIALATHLHRPDLLDVVHRNLHAQAALTDDDGLVETVHSRRQDQGQHFSIAPFTMQYRRFALLHGCLACAGSAALALTPPLSGPDAVGALAELLIEPALGGSLPQHPEPEVPEFGPQSWPQREPETHSFPSAGLVRIDRGTSVATVYGGSDVPRFGRVASGLACDPTFLRWRYGRVRLDSVRLSRNFFGLGPFRGELVSDGTQTHRLHESVSASYYQPLAEGLRRGDGEYGLEHEGRFAAAMSFSQRQTTPATLTTEITITAGPDSVTLHTRFTGVDTSYAFELCFRAGGVLEGARPLAEAGCYELVDGVGSYRVGDDLVSFGPGGGSGPHQPAAYDPGEAYTFLHGTDAAAGVRVYVTGRTSGENTLFVRAGAAERTRSAPA